MASFLPALKHLEFHTKIFESQASLIQLCVFDQAPYSVILKVAVKRCISKPGQLLMMIMLAIVWTFQSFQICQCCRSLYMPMSRPVAGCDRETEHTRHKCWIVFGSGPYLAANVSIEWKTKTAEQCLQTNLGESCSSNGEIFVVRGWRPTTQAFLVSFYTCQFCRLFGDVCNLQCKMW